MERWLPEMDEPEVLRDRIAWTAPGAVQPLEIDLDALFRTGNPR